MDALVPLLVSALTQIADGSLGEAGTSLWKSMTSLVGRLLPGDEQQLVPAVMAGTGLDPHEIAPLASFLADRADGDPQLASGLTQWLTSASGVMQLGDVSNSATGTIGKLVQARDIGNVNL